MTIIDDWVAESADDYDEYLREISLGAAGLPIVISRSNSKRFGYEFSEEEAQKRWLAIAKNVYENNKEKENEETI